MRRRLELYLLETLSLLLSDVSSMMFSILTSLIDAYYVCKSLSFSTVGNQEQGKQKTPRKSFSISLMLPHPSSPRKIRSAKTFSFLFFLPDSLLMVCPKIWKDLYHIVYLNELCGDYCTYLFQASTCLPASPLCGDLKWSGAQTWMCVYLYSCSLYRGSFARFYIKCDTSSWFIRWQQVSSAVM